jgi:hypothetical protein
MNTLKKWLQGRFWLIRLCLLLLVGVNLFSAYRIFPESPILVLAHVIMAVVLLLGAILIH